MRKVLFLTFFCIAAPIAFAQDPVKVDAKHYSVMLDNDQVRVLKIRYGVKEKSVMHEHPAHHKVVFENDRVRVLRVNFKAHDKTKQHEHPNGVAIYLTDAKAKFTLADGTTREGGGKRGEATWAAAEKHSVENTVAKPAEIILVELK
jgi:quercetin dioxygenase-like cupin family protein